MTIPTVKDVLRAARRLLPGAAHLAVGVRLGTWDAQAWRWAENPKLDEVLPLRVVLAQLRALLRKGLTRTMTLDLYVFSRTETAWEPPDMVPLGHLDLVFYGDGSIVIGWPGGEPARKEVIR